MNLLEKCVKNNVLKNKWNIEKKNAIFFKAFDMFSPCELQPSGARVLSKKFNFTRIRRHLFIVAPLIASFIERIEFCFFIQPFI